MEDEIKNQDIIDFRYKLIEFGCAKSYLVSGVSCNDGHSHDSLEYQSWGKSMDVGVDSAARILGEYRPFRFNEIKSILDKREKMVVDHHTGGT